MLHYAAWTGLEVPTPPRNVSYTKGKIIMRKIILASASPRRRELLSQMGLEFMVMPSDIEEQPQSMLPADMVIELSKQKARDIWEKAAGPGNKDGKDFGNLNVNANVDENINVNININDTFVIGADTVVSIEGEILGKPKDFDDAMRMLGLLSGKEHQVYTGVTMIWVTGEGERKEYSFYVCTGVVMYRISRQEMFNYVSSGDPMDKAGAYGVQGKAAAFIKSIRGEYSNVVGLPVGRLYQEMKAWHLLE